jgi:hypothetical protein
MPVFVYIHLLASAKHTQRPGQVSRVSPSRHKKLSAHFRAATAECWPQDHSSFLPRYLSTDKPALFEYNVFPQATATT